MILAMEVKEKAIGKARPRYSKYATYTPKKTKDFEEMIKWNFIKKAKKDGVFQEPSLKPISVKIEIEIIPPKSVSRKTFIMLKGKPHICRPDVDNIEKAILDALNGIAYKDDNQVYELYARKRYGEEDRIVIVLEEYV